MNELRLDLHILTSREGSADTGIDSFGWSGGGAPRITADLPWGAPTARAEDAPHLDGPPDRVLSAPNLDRLQFSFYPVGGRPTFSVWGVVGGQRTGSTRWRVVTHTVLLDETAFMALAGNPFVLLGTAERPGPWLPIVAREELTPDARLEPLRIPSSLAVFEAARTHWKDELLRLRRRLVRLYGAEGLERWVGVLYQSLSRAELRTALWTSPDRRHELLVRFAWLALPVTERLHVPFITEQENRTVHARLLAVDAREWEGRLPQGARWLDEQNLEMQDTSGETFAERAEHWITPLVRSEDGAAFFREFARAERRRMGVLGGFTWPRYCALASAAAKHPSVATARRFLEAAVGDEVARLPKAAVGCMAGHAVAAGDTSASADELIAALKAASAWSEPFVRGVVRGLRANSAPGPAALFRCRATSRVPDQALAAALARLEEPSGREQALLSPLLQDPAGPMALLESCAATARTLGSGPGAHAALRLGHIALVALPDPSSAIEWLAHNDGPVVHDWMLALLDTAKGRQLADAPFRAALRLLTRGPATDPDERLARFLGTPDVFRRAVASLPPEELQGYLAQTPLPPDQMAEALAEALPEAKPAAVTEVVRRLTRSGPGWIEVWAAASRHPEGALRIMLHDGWRETPRAATALRAATGLLTRTVGAEPSYPPDAVAAALRGLADRASLGGTLSSEEQALASAALRYLVQRRALTLPEPLLQALLEKAGPDATAELGSEVLRQLEGTDAAALPTVLPTLLRIALEARTAPGDLLDRALTALPWSRQPDFWRRGITAMSRSGVLGFEAVTAFARQGDPGLAHEVASVLLLQGTVTGRILAPLQALLRVEVLHGGGPAASLQEALVRDPAKVVPIAIQLLTGERDLRVFLAFRRALLKLPSASAKGEFPANVDLDAVRAASPAVATHLWHRTPAEHESLFIM